MTGYVYLFRWLHFNSCNGGKLLATKFVIFLSLLVFFPSAEDFFCGECCRLIIFLKMKLVKKKESVPEWWACNDFMFCCGLLRLIYYFWYVPENISMCCSFWVRGKLVNSISVCIMIWSCAGFFCWSHGYCWLSEDNLGAKGNGKISSSLIICGGNKWFYFLLITNLYILDLITAG